MHAAKTATTVTGVGVHIIVTGGAVLARVGCTLVDVVLTMMAAKTANTQACVVPDTVNAGSAI